MKYSKSSYLCPTCKQDMRDKPHVGLDGKDCPQCGQGLQWKFARFKLISKKKGEK